jgi:hypothetical protein
VEETADIVFGGGWSLWLEVGLFCIRGWSCRQWKVDLCLMEMTLGGSCQFGVVFSAGLRVRTCSYPFFVFFFFFLLF